ncbi:MAG TPA: LCP family protein [Pseudonocardia sp.]|nr:LCP family protein [Pseudonocardia sp.]
MGTPGTWTTRPPSTETATAAAAARSSRRSAPPARPSKPTAPALSAAAPATRSSTSDVKAARIDDTLSRITAAHAGLPVPGREDTEAPHGSARPARWPRLLVAALAAAVLLATSVGWVTKSWLQSGIPTVAALDPSSDLIVDAAAQEGDRNVLLVAGDPVADPNSATITVAHLPADGAAPTVLAFPSTLEIDRPACERWDPQSRSYADAIEPAAAAARLADALAVGGPRCVTRVVQQLSGIAITGFVGIDTDGLGAFATALGGIPLCAPRPVDDGALGQIVPAAGDTTLDAQRAVAYARAAAVAGDPPTGRARIERQQLLLAGALERTVGGVGLLDVPRIAELRPALGQAVFTDGVGLDETLELAAALRNLEADGITFAAAPTTGDPSGTAGPLLLRDVEASALFTAVRTDAALPADTGANGSGALAPGQLRVAVLNGTERSGLAAQVAETLGSFGYRVGEVGTAEQVTPQTLIRFSPDQASAAALLATSVPSAASVPDPGTSGVLQLVLGSSYDEVLRPPAPAAATTAPQAEPPRASCS